MSDVITTILKDAADAMRERIDFDNKRIEALTESLSNVVLHRNKARKSLAAIEAELERRKSLVFEAATFEFRNPNSSTASERAAGTR